MSERVNRQMRYVYIKVNKYNQEQIEALNRLMTPAVYNPELDLYQVDRNEYIQVPVLAECEFEELEEAQRRYDEALIDHTKSIIDEEKNKIYLTSLPGRDLKIINDPENKDVFGHDGKNYYIKKDYAESYKWHRYLKRWTKVDLIITATMFKPAKSKHKPTPGMYALADAFNIDDTAERAKAMADAIALCAKEHYQKVPGALNNIVNVISVSNKMKKGLNRFDAMTLGMMWSNAVGVYENLEKQAKYRNNPEILKAADVEVKNHCYAQAGLLLKSGLEKRLKYALLNSKPEIALGLARKAMVDYVKGFSLECEGHMYTDQYVVTRHNSYQFAKKLNKIFTDVNKELTKKKLPMLSENLVNEFEVMMELTDDQARRAQFIMNSGIQSKRGVAARSYYACQMALRVSPYSLDAEFDKIKIVKLNENKLKARELPILDGKKEPLFLCVRDDEREEFIKTHPEVCLDPTFNALCVENTLINKKKYLDYLPRDIKQQDYVNVMPQDHQKSYARALKVLEEHGIDVSKGIKINPEKGRFTMDKKNKSLGYICNINDGGIDRIQIKDFNGQYGEKGICIRLMDDNEWKNHQQSYGTLSKEEKIAFAKEEQFRAQNREALSRTAQIAASKFVDSQVGKAIDLQHEHAYLDKKELLFSDVKGLKYDKTGELTFKIMSGRNSVSEKELVHYADSVIIPLTNADGKVMSAQMITHDGEKLFAKGAPMAGNFFTVGGYDSLKKAKSILIAEGVATAASISKVAPEGTVVVAAMNCGNLVDVTKSLSEKFPNAGIGIMADNDLKSAGIDKINAGISHAYKASNNIVNIRPNVSVIKPPLTTSELKAGLSDFNDCLCHHDFDTPQRYESRVNEMKNRIFEAAEFAVMNHDLNVEARQIAQRNLAKHNQEELSMKQMAKVIRTEPKMISNEKDAEFNLDQITQNSYSLSL